MGDDSAIQKLQNDTDLSAPQGVGSDQTGQNQQPDTAHQPIQGSNPNPNPGQRPNSDSPPPEDNLQENNLLDNNLPENNLLQDQTHQTDGSEESHGGGTTNEGEQAVDTVHRAAVNAYSNANGDTGRNGGEQEAAEDKTFDNPGEAPKDEALPSDIPAGPVYDSLKETKDRLYLYRKNNTVYKAVCVARLLYNKKDNPLAAPESTSQKVLEKAETAWDSLVAVNNMVSGGNQVYSSLVSEGKTTNVISTITAAVGAAASAVDTIRNLKKIIQNFKAKNFWTLDNMLEVVSAISNACFLFGYIGSSLEAGFKAFGGRPPAWVNRFVKVSYFLTGSAEVGATLVSATKIGVLLKKASSFEKTDDLKKAKEAASGVINRYKKPDDALLDPNKESDRVCKSKARELLRRKEQGELQLEEEEVKTLVRYVTLRGRIDDARMSALKLVPGLLTSVTDAFASFWGGTHLKGNDDDSEDKVGDWSYAISGAFFAGSSALDLKDTIHDAASDGPGGEVNKMTANFMWNKFETLITHDEYGLKGLDLEIRMHRDAYDRNIADTLKEKEQSANEKYEDLGKMMESMYISVDDLLEASDIEGFKSPLVASEL